MRAFTTLVATSTVVHDDGLGFGYTRLQDISA
jgi:hypothetical protein